MICRFIETGFRDACANMAVDEALVQLSEKPVVRTYAWSPSAMTIGYGQSKIRISIVLKFNKN